MKDNKKTEQTEATGIKAYFANKKFTAWFIVACVLIPLMIVVIILTSTAFYDVVCNVLGRKIALYADGKDPRYVAEYDTKAEAYESAMKFNEEVCEEGFVLLKNKNALPLSDGAKISIFGKSSVNIVYGGSGSGGNNSKGRIKLHDSLRAAGFAVNGELEKFYNNNRKSGAGRSDNPTDLNSGADQVLTIGETPYSFYDDGVKKSYNDYKDAALIVLSRIGGEGFDLPRQSEGDETRHYLELEPNEKTLIENVTKAGFGKVIVLVNSAAVMELGFVEDGSLGNIDGCLWIGAPGNTGINALGRVLKGEVTPSGRTVDTFASDLFSAPATVNFGTNGTYEGDGYLVPDDKGNITTGSDGRPVASGYFVEYEEGIYVGYRYYETRAAAYNGKIDALGEETFATGEEWYKNNVVYPFGYGLSYTTFTQKITNKSELSEAKLIKGEKLTVKVEVNNTGTVKGKEVVQLYATAPYTPGGIEKAHKVLVGFAKTEDIAAGGTASVEIEIDPYDFASYDYDDKNDNKHKGYELDAGEYIFTLGLNAHEAIDSFKAECDGIIYDKDPVTDKTVENRFEDADAELEIKLSRADWNGTYPNVPTREERIKSKEFIDNIDKIINTNPNTYTEMPTTGAPVTLTLFDLIEAEDYKGYDDPRWEKILDSLTVAEMANLVNRGAFNTGAIVKIEKAATIDADGPAGFTVFMGDPSVYDTCAYASEIVMASTWSERILEEVGKHVGEEGLHGNEQGDGTPYSGWYAPGMNIHRTPFGGRNFEYFSEDSFISGKLAAAEIKGCASKGVYTYMKHFVANEQETHRSLTGLCTYLTEQVLRELYLKPFEIAVKEGEATGIMSSFNRIGNVWTGGDYRLLTEVLRTEWGFKGTVICDFNATSSYMNVKQMVYAGGDLDLANTSDYMWNDYNASSAADVTVLRMATKNILYTVSESNAMNAKITGYLLPLWMIVELSIIAALVAGLIAWGAVVIVMTHKALASGQRKNAESKSDIESDEAASSAD